MKTEKIAILGGGNIGLSIAEGLTQSKLRTPASISITKRKLAKISHLKRKGYNVLSDNIKAINNSEIIIVAVQPGQMKSLLEEISPYLKNSHLLVSVVTGFSIQQMQEIVGNKISLFRAMPNTAISIQNSMTCIATNNANKKQQNKVLSIFQSVGAAIYIEEELMASATVLGACGVAYALRFIRAVSQGGIEIGFDADIAQLIAAQTAKGAASLLLSSGKHPEREIDKVTTPQGCTIAGLNEMEHQGFSSALIKGLITSYNKITQISEKN